MTGTDTERRPLLGALAALAGGTALTVGWLSWPVHTDLYSVAFENRRSAAVELDVVLAANGVRVHQSTVELAPENRAVLPCAWPRPALSYRLAVRPAEANRWHAASFRGEGLHCAVVTLRPTDAGSEPVDFEYTVPCPPNTPWSESCE